MASVTWMWFGNQPQINANSGTPLTSADAAKMVGYQAAGGTQIKPVTVSGAAVTLQTDEGRAEAFRTTYNTGWALPSSLTYASPTTGQNVTSVITGFARVSYDLTVTGNNVVRQSGVLIQMRNGDMFFRPARDTVPEWDSITKLHSVKIVTVNPLPANNFVATVSFNPDIFELQVTCFVSGTLIRTAQGERPVEALRPGDLVWTRDNGFQPLRWCGSSHVDQVMLGAGPHLRPIRIDVDALGPNCPAAPLRVSPQHRILVRSAIAARMFGCTELLVPAKHLTDLPGVQVDEEADSVTYHHLMFDHHEVILSNGAETESLYPGPEAVKALPAEAVAEIEALFPGLFLADLPPPTARHHVRGPRVRRLAERHAAKQRPIVSRL